MENFEKVSNYQKGLDRQRELFKDTKFKGDFDGMADSLENLKSEIKSKMIKRGSKEQLERIENIIKWYRQKEIKYLKKTPTGTKIVFPSTMPMQIIHNLTVCFELIISEMDSLGLL